MMRVWIAALGLCVLAGVAHAQVLPEQQSLESHRRVTAELIARDGMQSHWVDRSTAQSANVTHPPSGLTCMEVSAANARLSYIPPSPSITSAACEWSLEEIRITTRALTGAQDQATMNTGLQATARVRLNSIQGVPWTGPITDVSGESTQHPPHQIIRAQGVFDGEPVYFRFAWARVGEWWISQATLAPLADQAGAELLASIHFYGALALANAPAPEEK